MVTPCIQLLHLHTYLQTNLLTFYEKSLLGHFQLKKWTLSCVATSIHAGLFINLEYLDHNLQTNLELVEQFCTKLTIHVFHSIWQRWKSKQNLEEKDKLVLSPKYQIENPLCIL